jgi:hypothetical protein
VSDLICLTWFLNSNQWYRCIAAIAPTCHLAAHVKAIIIAMVIIFVLQPSHVCNDGKRGGCNDKVAVMVEDCRTCHELEVWDQIENYKLEVERGQIT